MPTIPQFRKTNTSVRISKIVWQNKLTDLERETYERKSLEEELEALKQKKGGSSSGKMLERKLEYTNL